MTLTTLNQMKADISRYTKAKYIEKVDTTKLEKELTRRYGVISMAELIKKYKEESKIV